MNDNLNRIEHLIPYDRPINRLELTGLVNLSDRKIRKMIELLREQKNDYVIISSSHSKGYYKSKDVTEINQYIEEQTRRAIKILWNLKTAKQFLGEKDQLRIIWE